MGGNKTVLEYIDALHEHFENPAAIKDGHHVTPTSPGYSVHIKPKSMEKFTFPGGRNSWWASKEAEPLLKLERTVGWQPAFGKVSKLNQKGKEAAFANDDGKT